MTRETEFDANTSLGLTAKRYPRTMDEAFRTPRHFTPIHLVAKRCVWCRLFATSIALVVFCFLVWVYAR